MKDIRRDYAEEIDANKTMREEIVNFQRNTDEFCHEISASLKSESRRIDAIHREILQDMDEIQKRRKKDRTGIELELKDTRRQIALEREVSQEVRINVEYLSRIIGLVLEGERLTSAMLVQDFADRSAEKWLSLPVELGRRPQMPQIAESLDQQRHREGWNRQRPELVPIDPRKGLVKSEYLPGQVSYQGVVYERKDFLLLQHKLLQKAHGALVKGPLGDDDSNVATVSGQPGASGGIAVGQVPVNSIHTKVEEEDEKSKSKPSSPGFRRGGGSRQRPGSQGQPQAMGSRGTMSGPLGETTPPPPPSLLPSEPHGERSNRSSGAAPLRLPAINGAVGGGGGTADMTGRSSSSAADGPTPPSTAALSRGAFTAR